MSTRKPVIEWERDGENDGWFIVAAGLIVRAWDDCGWRVSLLGHIVKEGDADSPSAAQLAAEDGALGWLSAVGAELGARMLERDEASLCVEVLRSYESSGWASKERSDAALALARKLGGR